MAKEYKLNEQPVYRYSAAYSKPFRFRDTGNLKAIGPPDGHNVASSAPDLTPNRRMINGRPVQSIGEYNLYQAMLKQGVPKHAIHYQVPWSGGRSLGGQILDFVVHLGGAPVVIRVMGSFFHDKPGASARDFYGKTQLMSSGYLVKDIPHKKLLTVEDALTALQGLNIF